MIAVNRRDFPDSTPYSPEELADLKSPEVDASKCLLFLHKRGLELIGFIHHIIEELGLPKNMPDGTGSITILAWSLGSIYCFSAMGCFNDTDLPAPLKKTIKECISGIILLGTDVSFNLSC
jgi:hypothetical protein